MNEYNSIVICGPTATGKTRIAAELALRLEGEIISLDSRQVYRELTIGSGKDLAEYTVHGQQVPYHCIDLVSVRELYTLWHFQRDFYAAFKDVSARGALPVLAGGTGLYLEAVLRHYVIPNVPEDEDRRRELLAKTSKELITILNALPVDKYKVAIDYSSKKRIARAIEVLEYGQHNPVQWGHPAHPDIRPEIFCIYAEREVILKRIRARLEARMKEGMVDEVRQILESGISLERLELLGMEYKHIGRWVVRGGDCQDMVEALYTDICRLAKRQMTWFRGMERRGFTLHWIENTGHETAVGAVLNFLSQ